MIDVDGYCRDDHWQDRISDDALKMAWNLGTIEVAASRALHMGKHEEHTQLSSGVAPASHARTQQETDALAYDERQQLADYLREKATSGITRRYIQSREFNLHRKLIFTGENEVITQEELGRAILNARGLVRISEGVVLLDGSGDGNNQLIQFNTPRVGHCLVCQGRGTVEFVSQVTSEWGECPCPECGG
jgi:hypothetical protein